MSRAWKAGTGIRIVVTPRTFSSALRGAPKAAGCALRRDVVIQVKDVVRVVAPFHLAEAVDVRSLGRADSDSQRVVAQELVAAHGGSIRLLDSDHGAAFEVEIPDRGA